MAGNDISLTTADEADHYNSVKKKKKSGFASTGTSKQKATHDRAEAA